MIPKDITMNKGIWLNHLLLGLVGHSEVDSPTLRKLLEPLSLKELRILKKHNDLLERVVEICKYSKLRMIAHLAQRYSMKVVNCQNGDVWIMMEDMEDFIPDWVEKAWGDTLPHHGWYLSYAPEDNEFMPWAREMLLQEVRANSWMRYMQYKMDMAAGKNPFGIVGQVHDFGGSGNNYV